MKRDANRRITLEAIQKGFLGFLRASKEIGEGDQVGFQLLEERVSIYPCILGLLRFEGLREL